MYQQPPSPFQPPSQPYAAYPPAPPPSPSPSPAYPMPPQPGQAPQQALPYPGIPQQPMPPSPFSPFPGMQPQQFAPPMQPYLAQPVMQQVNVTVAATKSGPGFVVRALYFLCVGWWLGLLWMHIGFALCAGIITLPLGLYMLNRLPQVMTLRQPSQQTKVNIASSQAVTPGAPMMQPGMMQTMHVTVSIGELPQRSFLLRALYYIFIGCWLGYLWAWLAYGCCATIVLLPIGVMLFDRLPVILTLRRV